MPRHQRSMASHLKGLWGWLGGLIEDVPADIAACEFECRKPNCDVGEWETCDRRLFIAEGERRQESDD